MGPRAARLYGAQRRVTLRFSVKPGALTRFCHNLSNGRISINVYGIRDRSEGVERWTTKRLWQERSIFAASPKTSAAWPPQRDTTSAAGTNSWPWLTVLSGLQIVLNKR